MANPYGVFGKPNRLIETYKAWRDDRVAAVERGEIEESLMRADFPEFLFGPVRYSMWQAYSKVQPQYRRYARIENLPDFRERRLRGLNGLQGFAYVGENGQYVEMTRSERKPAVLSVDTYGAVLGISRQAVINDESGDLLSRNPADMGFRAATFIAEALVAFIESNPNAPDGAAMTSSGRGNQTTNPLSEDSIVDAMAAMQNQRDDDNYRIQIRVGALIVQSPRSEMIAKRVNNSTLAATSIQWGSPAAGTGSQIMDKGNLNPVAGILPADGIVREPFFTDANDYYLFADPNDVPAFALGFLNGQEQPFIGLRDPAVRNALGAGMDPYSFDFDVIEFKVRHDFGFASVDPRGIYKGVVP